MIRKSSKSAAAALALAGLAVVGLGDGAAAAGPQAAVSALTERTPSAVEKAQVSISIGVGRPYRPYGYYGGYGPYYRPYYRPYGGYYYAPPPPLPPAVTYYETRPYVARPAYRGRDPDALARCASRFRSFNAHTGTYVTFDGEERLCPYLR